MHCYCMFDRGNYFSDTSSDNVPLARHGVDSFQVFKIIDKGQNSFYEVTITEQN